MKLVTHISFFTLLTLFSCQKINPSKNKDVATEQDFSLISALDIQPLASSISYVSTLAGSSTAGFVDGPAKRPEYDYPFGIAMTISGDIFVADFNNNCIRKITSTGIVTTIAGDGTTGYANGTGSSAKFNHPSALVLTSTGDLLVTDQSNHLIRKVTQVGVVTTIAGSTAGYANGTALTSKFNNPSGITVDGSGNIIVSELGNHTIRKISTTGIVSTLAGSGSFGYQNGTGTSALFNQPLAIDRDGSGNFIVIDGNNSCIRKITPTGLTTTIAGSPTMVGYQDGNLSTAKFSSMYALKIDGLQNIIVSDLSFGITKIRKINLSTNLVSTITGTAGYGYVDGGVAIAKFATIWGITTDANNNIFLAEANNNYIRKISTAGQVTTISGDGTAGLQDGNPTQALAKFNKPISARLDYNGDILIGDKGNNRIRKMNKYGIVTTLPGVFTNIESVAGDINGNVYVGDFTKVSKISNSGIVSVVAGTSSQGYQDGAASTAKFNFIEDIVVTPSGTIILADAYNNCIRAISSSGNVSTLAGNGTIGFADGIGSNARFHTPITVSLDYQGKLIISDFLNYSIRKLDLSTNQVTTVYTSPSTSIYAVGVNQTTTDLIYSNQVYSNATTVASATIFKVILPSTVSVITGGAAGYIDGTSANARHNYARKLIINTKRNIIFPDVNNNCIRIVKGNW